MGNECNYINDICKGILNQLNRVHRHACIFSEICIPRASTLAKKPAKPQSTKTSHSTGYASQNKVGPS